MIADPVPVASSSSPTRGRERRETLPESAPLAYPPLGVGILTRSIEVAVACRVGRALAPQTVCGLVDGSALAVTHHDLLLPACSLVAAFGPLSGSTSALAPSE